MRLLNNMPSFVISSHSMHLGVLATASHTIRGSLFILVSDNERKSKMSFLSFRFGQFCDFRPNVCFSAYGSKRFKTLPYDTRKTFGSRCGKTNLWTKVINLAKPQGRK
ncbi:hypothetical protein Hanom_Chr13g01187301 [Helianthus anomalus]